MILEPSLFRFLLLLSSLLHCYNGWHFPIILKHCLYSLLQKLLLKKKKSKIANVDVPQEKRKREKRSKNRTKIIAKDAKEQTEKESKKRKRETEDESAPPKNRKNKTGFLDPSDDSDLSEQAQKG